MEDRPLIGGAGQPSYTRAWEERDLKGLDKVTSKLLLKTSGAPVGDAHEPIPLDDSYLACAKDETYFIICLADIWSGSNFGSVENGECGLIEEESLLAVEVAESELAVVTARFDALALTGYLWKLGIFRIDICYEGSGADGFCCESKGEQGEEEEGFEEIHGGGNGALGRRRKGGCGIEFPVGGAGGLYENGVI